MVVNDRLQDALEQLTAIVAAELGRARAPSWEAERLHWEINQERLRPSDLTPHRPSARQRRLQLRIVLVAAKRARQINSYYHNLGEGTFDEFPPPMVETISKNYLTIALEEVAAGKIKYHYRWPQALAILRPHSLRASTLRSLRP